MKAFVTGSAGFLGQHVLAALMQRNGEITTYDRRHGQDVLNIAQLVSALKQAQPDVVYHLAALADVRRAFEQPIEQRQQNLEATAILLEAMRAVGVKQIVFPSSAVVYGDAQPGTLSETSALGKQTSIYGAMKLASESLIQAYCHGFGMRGDILRTVSLVGPHYRHGNIFDFYQRLTTDPSKLHILGTGQEQKYYVYAADMADAMVRAASSEHDGCETWNVSGDTPIRIRKVADIVCEQMNIEPARTYEQNTWRGDLPSLILDTSKLKGIGWKETMPLSNAISETVHWFQEAGL